MCGIAFSLTEDAVTGENFSNHALRLLSHRGPDGQGKWNDSRAWLIHTRLAIQDLSEAGHQPMFSQSDRFVITFNGEIYNHLELRQKFLKDITFRGHSDTETLLALFEKMGEQMLEHLVGMWAFVIWDKRDQRAFISRDRFGQKPLYWARTKNAWLFASELKPILKVLGPEEPNTLAVSEYLALGNYEHLGQETFYQHVFSLRAGHYAYIKPAEFQFASHSYWSLQEIPYKDRIPLGADQLRQFRDLVLQAVSSQLLSDVPVGATLSGGLDSSIIASCVALLGRKHFPVFTAQFPGTDFDETKYVEAMKKKWGQALEVVYAPVQELNLRQDLERTLMEQEQPFGDPSIMAHGYLVKYARHAKVPVLLGGQGGDEVSMGYPWMYHRLISYALANGDYRPLKSFLSNERWHFSQIGRLLLAGMTPQMEGKMRLLSRQKQKDFMKSDYRLPSPTDAFGQANRFNDIYKESLYSVGLPHLCHYDDRSTMAHSIEGRMPFLDHRLFEFASRLQVNAFYRQGFSKYVLRQAFQDILPQEIAARKDKIGFYTPLQRLVSQDAPQIKKEFQNNFEMNLWVTPEHLDSLYNALDQAAITPVKARQIFRLLSLTIWSRQNQKCTEL